jgi:two-component system KDP operon response regulator KdpE
LLKIDGADGCSNAGAASTGGWIASYRSVMDNPPSRDGRNELPPKYRPRILVIDDDSDITEFFGAVLSARDYQVTIAHTVEEGLIDFADLKYDVVFMDLFMDGMGGIKGIEVTHQSASDFFIIVISAGYNDIPPDAALKAALKIGADKALAKPFTADDLANVTADALDSRRTEL